MRGTLPDGERQSGECGRAREPASGGWLLAVATPPDQGLAERQAGSVELPGSTFYLRVRITADAMARFSYSTDGSDFKEVGEPFALKPGRWIGTKIGLFALGIVPVSEYGYADVDWFRVE